MIFLRLAGITKLPNSKLKSNYPLNAQVPTTKLKTEITSEPLKSEQ